MKRFFAIFPGTNGLECRYLGLYNNFDAASDAADELNENVIWISDWDDIINLMKSIDKATQ